MKAKQEQLMMLAFCGLLVLLSVGGIVLTLLSDLIWTLDGLLLVLICLMIGGLFSLFLLLGIKDAGWLPARKPAGEPSAANGPAKPVEAPKK